MTFIVERSKFIMVINNGKMKIYRVRGMTLLHFLIGCFVANNECVAACPREGSRTFRGQFALVIAVNCGI